MRLIPYSSTRCSLILFLAAGNIFAGNSPLFGGESNDQEGLVIALDGKARASIVIPTDAPGSVVFAAEELRNFLSQSTGGKFVVVRSPGASPNIFLGESPRAQKAGLKADSLKRDGFYWGVVDGDLYIVGRDDPDKRWYGPGWREIYREHGTLYGVYDFLEQVCGVRWLLPGTIGEVVPSHPTLRIPGGIHKSEPVFAERYFSQVNFLFRKYPDARAYVTREDETFLWALRMRFGSENIVRGSHAAHHFKYGERFGAKHPEWFALRKNGERAINTPRGAYMSWGEPGIINEMAKDARAYLTGKPASSRGLDKWPTHYGEHFMVDPNDAFITCQSESTQRFFREHPKTGTSELIFSAVARVAKSVSDLEGKYITTLAYPPKLLPPKTVSLPENVRVRLCIAGPNATMRPRSNRAQMALLHEWRKRVSGGLTLWTYPLTSQGRQNLHGAVEVMPHATAEFFREVEPHIDGLYWQNYSLFQTYRNLDTYIALRLGWNPQTDVDALLDDYFEKLYGPASAPIQAIYAQLESCWKQTVTFHELPEHADLLWRPVPATPSRIDLWEKIYTSEVLNGIDQRLTQASEDARGNELVTQRVAILRKWLYGSMVSYREAYERETGAGPARQSVAYRATQPAGRDGLLPASAWKRAEWQALVSATEHDASVDGKFKVLWTPDAFHLYAKLDEPKISRSATVPDRKADDLALWQDNDLEVRIDVGGEFTRQYHIMVNDRGVITDLESKLGSSDLSWDSGAVAKVDSSSDQWQLYLSIPLDRMEDIDLASKPTLGWNVTRHRSIQGQDSEYHTWSPAAQLKRWKDPVCWGSVTFDTAVGLGRELIDNGSFEAPGKGSQPAAQWVVPSSQPPIVKRIKKGGQSSVRISSANQSQTAGIKHGLKPLKPNTTYLLQFRVKTENIVRDTSSSYTGAMIQWFIAPGSNPFSPLPGIDGTHDWRTIKVKATTPETIPANAKSYLRPLLQKAKGTVWFDDVSLREIIEK